MNLQRTSIRVFTFLTFLLLVVVAAKKNFYDGPSHFDVVLSSILRKSIDQLSVNKHVRRAVKFLREELQREESGQDNKPQVRKKKSSSDDFANNVEDLLNTVENFFQDEGIKKPSEKNNKKKKDSKEKSELAKFIADFEFLHMEVETHTINTERIKRLFYRGFTLMNSRPVLLKNIVRTIEDLALVPPQVTNMLNIEKTLTVVSQLVAFWNSPMGETMIKPMWENTIKTLVASNLDMNSIKPTVDLVLATTLDANTRKQVRPFVDLFFSVTTNIVRGLKKAGYGELIKNFRIKTLLKGADDAYTRFMIGMMNVLQEALESAETILVDLETVVAVVDKYGRIPGTMDKKFKIGGEDDEGDDDDDDNPVFKVNSIVTRIRKATVVVKQSKVSILAWEPYYLQHPSLAIEAFKEAVVAVDVGARTLEQMWPLKGYLTTHPAVKKYSDIGLQVAQVKDRMKRAIDKTHKLEVLMHDIKNMTSIFDVIDLYKDLRAILYGQPHFGLVVTILDILNKEMQKMKEVQYSEY